MPKQDLQCLFCSKTSSHGAGLASHIRGAHPKQHAAWSKARKSSAPTSVASPLSASGGIGLGGIVARLEHQRDAIVAALNALREIGGVAVLSGATAEPTAGAKSKRKRRLTPEGRERLIAALKKRWAAKKAEQSRPAASKSGRRPGRPTKSA